MNFVLLGVKKWICLIIGIAVAINFVFAQTEYNMQNRLVHDCEGILTHSQAGEKKNYDHNEDFTFTICVPRATAIILNFEFFATEKPYDVMTIYDGPDRNSPILGTLTGILRPAPGFVARSGCVTIHFKSDDNITANGWKMNWMVLFELPTPPSLKILSSTDCPLTELILELGYPVPCKQIVPGNFSILGQGATSIVEAEPLDCINGVTRKIRIKFDPPLNRPVNYRLSFAFKYIDECGKEHSLISSLLFNLNNCPFTVEINMLDSAACAGLCTELEANTLADSKQSFNYLWLPGRQTTKKIKICDRDTAIYLVVATDSISGRRDTARFTYIPLKAPQILNPIQDTICASALNWKYNVDQNGGNFYSSKYPAQNNKTGVYEFWRHAKGNGLQTDTLCYVAPNGCKVCDTVLVWPIDPGQNQKACLGGPTITLNGATPSGGTWSGSKLGPNRSFVPDSVGLFSFQYTALNGCTATRNIEVFNLPKIVNPIQDTFCSSAPNWQYRVTIPGGDFYSLIIPNQQRKSGIYEFWRLLGNDSLRTDTVLYIDPNGCRVRDTIYILPVSAGQPQSVCQLSGSFQLTGAFPTKGFWSGKQTDSSGIFNPIDTGTFLVSYQASNGCIAKKNVRVNQVPKILNPVSDTVCASAANWQYRIDLPGGTFAATAIPAAQNKTGIYPFDYWSRSNQIQRDIVVYTATNTCKTSDTLYIIPIDAGLPDAACLGTSDFNLKGNHPAGGRWTGNWVDSTGKFSPLVSGTHQVQYKAPNGCVDTKTIFVTDSIQISAVDSLCYLENFNFTFNPLGGFWSGLGIVDSVNGKVNLSKAISNQWNLFNYRINGCDLNVNVFVSKPNAGPDQSLCLGDDYLYLPGAGRWTGPGKFDLLNNRVDIDSLPPGKHQFQINFKQCRDTFIAHIHDVHLKDSSKNLFCPYVDTINLIQLLSPSEAPGFFSGNGIEYIDSQYLWLPQLAGSGRHTIYYKAFGCQDSVELEVEPPIKFAEYEFCDRSPPTILSINPPGGYWEGSGFLDEKQGLFDPGLSGIGTHKVSYITPAGCREDTVVKVESWSPVSISGLDAQYCYKDQNIPVILNPPGGEFYINGVLSLPLINPAKLGWGNWELKYSRGKGNCVSSERIFINILPPISKKSLSKNDTICSGERTSISIDALGGKGSFIYTWDNALGFGSSHVVAPLQDTWFIVTVTDGCSDPLIDSVLVKVHPEFIVDTIQGPKVCYGETTFVELKLDTSEFVVKWQTNPVKNGIRLNDLPGVYRAELLQKSTGCRQEQNIELPGAEPIVANFNIIPNQECIDNINNLIEIIDLAFGYTSGTIDFGDGSPAVDLLQPGALLHEYQDTGKFVIVQRVKNELGCIDEFSRIICILNKVRIYIPNIFSPNGDGKLDEFKITHYGVDILRWSIYDRNGALCFDTRDGDASWDGSFNGKRVVEGVYIIAIEYFNRNTGRRELFKSDLTVIR
ncbi:MAG: T9SS type B sorting domain-containing protein [Saprospiraceae bacterium]|nr:T9SS type B sorting domain-containing protein [Saprospiraceae bacterium]